MILELADIRIHPGQHAAFEKNVTQALASIFPKSKGFKGHQFRRCLETPERYVLLPVSYTHLTLPTSDLV